MDLETNNLEPYRLFSIVERVHHTFSLSSSCFLCILMNRTRELMARGNMPLQLHKVGLVRYPAASYEHYKLSYRRSVKARD
jgi:hypothetical protein